MKKLNNLLSKFSVNSPPELQNLISPSNDKVFDFDTLTESLSSLSQNECIKVQNCPSMSSAFDTFIALVALFFMRIPTALGVLIELKGSGSFLSDQQFLQIFNVTENFKRSFILAYQSVDESFGFIYWRLEGNDQIFCMKIEKYLTTFVLKTLVRCLKEKHSGE